jgi:CPA2 family monovalent cation:H+ antiporter-2
VISEEYEAAKEIFTRALRKYRLPESEIGKIVKKLHDRGYAKFIRNGENETTIPAMDTVLLSLHIQRLIIEPGSFAGGKTIADLELTTRYGIPDIGLRRDNATDITPHGTTRLQAGDALMLFFRQDRSGDCRHVQQPPVLMVGLFSSPRISPAVSAIKKGAGAPGILG